MELEQIGKKLKVFASVAAKKTGDAVEITKHTINKAGLEKEIDDLYNRSGSMPTPRQSVAASMILISWRAVKKSTLYSLRSSRSIWRSTPSSTPITLPM